MKRTMKFSFAALFFALLLAPAAADATIGASCTVSSKTGTCRANVSACSSTEDSTGGRGNCSNTTEICCTPKAASGSTVTFSNPLAFNTVQDVTGALLNALQGIIVLLSLVFIVIGAVLYITSGGSDKQITTAKGAITAAMIGLAIGIAAPSFLKEIAGILNWGGAVPAQVSGAQSLATIIQNVLNFLLSIAGILAMIMLVFGGVMYLTSAGDEKKTDTAKNIVKWAIIGVIVTLASLVIVKQIAAFF